MKVLVASSGFFRFGNPILGPVSSCLTTSRREVYLKPFSKGLCWFELVEFGVLRQLRGSLVSSSLIYALLHSVINSVEISRLPACLCADVLFNF